MEWRGQLVAWSRGGWCLPGDLDAWIREASARAPQAPTEARQPSSLAVAGSRRPPRCGARRPQQLGAPPPPSVDSYRPRPDEKTGNFPFLITCPKGHIVPVSQTTPKWIRLFSGHQEVFLDKRYKTTPVHMEPAGSPVSLKTSRFNRFPYLHEFLCISYFYGDKDNCSP
jgi:hypothetical protein